MWGRSQVVGDGPFPEILTVLKIRISSARSTVGKRCAMIQSGFAPQGAGPQRVRRGAPVAGSRRDEASSRMIRSGSARKTRAKARSWACPASPVPPGPQLRVESLRKAREPFAQSELVQHLCDRCVGDARVKKREVVAHAGLEELHLLGDERHAPADVADGCLGRGRRLSGPAPRWDRRGVGAAAPAWSCRSPVRPSRPRM